MNKVAIKQYRIRRLEIKFLGKTGNVEDVHETKFHVPPIVRDSKNILETVKDSLDKAIAKDKRKKIIIVTTAQGKFYYTRR